MRKFIFIVIVLGIVLATSACSETANLPEGIRLANPENGTEVFDMLKPDFSLEDLINNKAAVLKFEVLDVIRIVYNSMYKDSDYVIESPGTILKVKVLSVLDDSLVKEGNILTIFTEHSPQSYESEAVNLQEGGVYIAMLGPKEDLIPDVLNSFVDYYILDSEKSVIICDGNNYIIHERLAGDMGLESKIYNTNKDPEEKPSNYIKHEILPQNEERWRKHNSVFFEATFSDLLKGK